MTERRKKLLRWLGLPLLAFLTFLFALHYTFPYDRLRARLIEMVPKEYDLTIDEIGPGIFPGSFRLSGITLTIKPTNERDKPKVISISELKLSVGLFALLGKTAAVDLSAELAGGKLVGSIEAAQKGLSVDFHTEDISLELVPGINAITGGAPINGPVEMQVKLSLPQWKWGQANGNVDISCSDCAMGDGVTKIRFSTPGQPTNAFMSEGFTLPKIRLGQLVGKVQIKQGVACIEQFGSKSNEGELSVDGGLKFADPFKDTQAQLYARVKLSDDFKKQSARNLDFDTLTFASARGADGFSSYQTKTPLTSLRWLIARTPPPPMPECGGIARNVPIAAPSAPAKPPVVATSRPPTIPEPPLAPPRPSRHGGDEGPAWTPPDASPPPPVEHVAAPVAQPVPEPPPQPVPEPAPPVAAPAPAAEPPAAPPPAEPVPPQPQPQ